MIWKFVELGKSLISSALREFQWNSKRFVTRLLPQMSLDRKLFPQLLVIGFCLFCSRTGNRQVQRFPVISGYCLDDQRNFHALPGNPQQIFAYRWYIFKRFIKFLLQIQNTKSHKYGNYVKAPYIVSSFLTLVPQSKPQGSPHRLPGWTNSPISPSHTNKTFAQVYLLQDSDLQLGKSKRAP